MRALAVVFVVVFGPGDVFAHKLLLAAKVEGDRVRIEVFFDDDTPAQEATVVVFSAGGKERWQGTTDERGIWNIAIPKKGKYAVIAKSLGHSAKGDFETLADGEPVPEDLPSTADREERTRTPWVKLLIGLVVIFLLALGLRYLNRSGAHRPLS